MLLCGALTAAPAKDCTQKMEDCTKLHKCAKTPESKECKTCKSDYDKCAASEEVTRAKTKKTKFPY
jgi:hypothetical protein